MKNLIKISVPLTALLPFVALAQSGTQVVTILTQILTILNIVVPIVLGLGIIYFIYGVISYVTAKDEEKKKEARGIMIYGIIGIFVIASIWGLVALIANFTGVGQGGGISNPYSI